MVRLLVILILFPLVAMAQTIHQTTNEVLGLIAPEEGTLAGVIGSWRWTINATQGGTPVDFTAGTYAYTLTLYNLADGFRALVTTNNPSPRIASTNGQVRFAFVMDQPGTYEAQAVAVPVAATNEAFPIAWLYLLVTNAPSSSGDQISINVTNIFPSSSCQILASNALLGVATAINFNAQFGVSLTDGVATVDGAAGGGGMDPVIASNSFLIKAGDAMAGGLDMGNNAISNAFFFGDGAGITNLPASGAIASNSFVTKTGDTMTGELTFAQTGTVQRIKCLSSSLALGSNAVINYNIVDSVAIGKAAVGNAANSVAIGSIANGKGGVAVGYNANGYNATVVGSGANANDQGAGLGQISSSYTKGVAVGYGAAGDNYGVALGWCAYGGGGGVAIGYKAIAYGSNIAIGSYSTAGLQIVGQPGKSLATNRIAIGNNITNLVQDSCAIRGSLYLDGATQLVFRSTFGSGDWTVGLQTETGRLYSINSDGTRTLISPHAVDGATIMLSENPYAGQRTVLHLERIASALEAMGHTGMIERTTIPRRDWDEEQSARASARLDEIAAWDKARAAAVKAADAWDATPAKDREGQERPAIPALTDCPKEYVPVPCPAWIKQQKEK